MKKIAKCTISVLNSFGFDTWNNQTKRSRKALRSLGRLLQRFLERFR